MSPFLLHRDERTLRVSSHELNGDLFPWYVYITSLIYEDYDNPPYSMQGPLMTHPTYRSPCNHEVILTKLDYKNERYLLGKSR